MSALPSGRHNGLSSSIEGLLHHAVVGKECETEVYMYRNISKVHE